MRSFFDFCLADYTPEHLRRMGYAESSIARAVDLDKRRGEALRALMALEREEANAWRMRRFDGGESDAAYWAIAKREHAARDEYQRLCDERVR